MGNVPIILVIYYNMNSEKSSNNNKLSIILKKIHYANSKVIDKASSAHYYVELLSIIICDNFQFYKRQLSSPESESLF
jgi:hypothetical protein